MTDDITEEQVRITLRNLWLILLSAVAGTTLIITTLNGLSSKADAAMLSAIRAENSVAQINAKVSKIECLMQQQTTWIIYKVKPTVSCDTLLLQSGRHWRD